MEIELDEEMKGAVLERLVDRIWNRIENSIEELTCISVPRAAGMLDLSTPQARRVFEETIDFGPRETRISIASLRRVIEARRVKRGKRR